ncbi:MAG: hypothetical protein QNL04_01285 [SAR324 cluster bacterium]|nr:hypothetical protein [SAR324 cluster bacterium]
MKSLNELKKKQFIALSLIMLALGTTGGFTPRFFTSPPEALTVGLSHHQLARIAFSQAQNKKLAESKEATLFLLQKGYTQPNFAHWALGHLGLISIQEKDFATTVGIYQDLVRLRGLEQDKSNYVWALAQKTPEKPPANLEKALELLTESQEKVKELGAKLQSTGETGSDGLSYPNLQLEAWEAAKKVELLLAALGQPQT